MENKCNCCACGNNKRDEFFDELFSKYTAEKDNLIELSADWVKSLGCVTTAFKF